MINELTCIICPIGCSLTVESEGGKIVKVDGNTCPRGKTYAIEESTNPVRTVTSTMCCDDGTVVSVRTDRPIPKEKIKECMDIINKEIVCLPISVGDIIIKDVFGSNIIATQNKLKSRCSL